ncbi:hypothetical protein ACGF1Z_03995 [Streptomyces sp. NPDC048018]|uniref:hypothetical protein n=1 Tax=Streptomyces sp. NPDC048018 TaxID=3365499 RepID=UPI0037220365
MTTWSSRSVLPSAVDANAVSTAAIVLGERAPDWLLSSALPARLTSLDGRIVRLGGWPSDSHAPAPPRSRKPDPGGAR